MLPTALRVLACAVALGLTAAAQQPANPDVFATRQDRGITLNYNIDMSPQDVDAMVGTLAETRELLGNILGITYSIDPIVQLRTRKNARRAYYTDGEDRIFFDFPSAMYVVRLQYGDERILRYAVPAFLQLWLHHSLSSTAGLDPRILESLTEYVNHSLAIERARAQKAEPPPPPTGPGAAWVQLESVYPGTTSFILNNLSSQKVPGHALGKVIRQIALDATEDAQVARIFDVIAPVEPILAVDDVKPGELVVPTLPLRAGRLTLFNGTPVLDADGEAIPALERLADFDKIFEMLAVTVPDSKVRNEPPVVREIDLWPLYFEFRPRILKARDNLDYYLVFREFLGRFKDRSIAVRTTPALPIPPGSPMWSSIFGLGFARIGDRIYVAKVTPDSEPAKAGLSPGLEVATIDGRAAVLVHELLVDVVQTFDSCPSRQRAEAFALSNLLSGAQGSECTLEFVDPSVPVTREAPDANRRTIKFKRGLPPPPRPTPFTVEHELRASDMVGVITVRQLMGDALQRFATALDELTKGGAKAIVIDLRGNEGLRDPRNPTRVSLAMLARLMPPGSGSLLIGSDARRETARFDGVQSKELVVPAATAATYFSGPIAVLTDAWTGGDAEVFVLGFQTSKRGILVGGRTAGSVSTLMDAQPLQSLTRSRIDISFAASSVILPSGEPLQGAGLAPQEQVETTPADLKAGRDTALERAAAKLLGRP